MMTHPNTYPHSATELRALMRQKRRNLTSQQQKLASIGCLEQIIAHPILKNCQQIALYLQNDGELSTQPIIQYCWANHINVYLPGLLANKPGFLEFIRFSSDSKMKTNRFGIAEPVVQHAATISPSQLDIIFLPLVAFDVKGSRLGMGGGFYDRTLGEIEKAVSKPMKIGLAHDFQQHPCLDTNPWDQPLDAIITPKRWISTNHRF